MKEEFEETASGDGPDTDVCEQLFWPCIGVDICAALIVMLAPVVPGMAAWERSAFQGVCVLALIATNICLGMSIRP